MILKVFDAESPVISLGDNLYMKIICKNEMIFRKFRKFEVECYVYRLYKTVTVWLLSFHMAKYHFSTNTLA